ncbi:MAG: hypothetical protein KDB33_02245 [Acidimicrobiales bacterium]|nr:hypothetical protein [Acidimicrobiales bacterium]
MRRAPVLLTTAVAVAALAGACSSSSTPEPSGTTADPGPAGTAAATEGTAAGGTTPGTDVRPAGALRDQYGERYCEVLTVTVSEVNTQAEVWGTQGLNDCPADAFAGIDPAAAAADLGTTLALPNGPRYWVLDDIVANQLAGSGERHSFNGLEMRSIAIVDLGPGIPDRQPYAGSSVNRDTEFRFDAGREVYELTADDGTVYIMQSYSIEIDPTLTADDLAGLGDRLALPEGWTFRARTLDEPLVVEDVDGIATVIQDELRNSYQLLPQG